MLQNTVNGVCDWLYQYLYPSWNSSISASRMTYIVLGGALNSTHSLMTICLLTCIVLAGLPSSYHQSVRTLKKLKVCCILHNDGL